MTEAILLKRTSTILFPKVRFLPFQFCSWVTGLVFVLLSVGTYAQCPLTACLPSNAPAANYIFGMGIYRVQLAGLDTITNGVADGYRDYSCRTGVALERGATYLLTVSTNPNADETVRAWVDFDGDGQFSASEMVLSSNAARQHQGLFVVPTTAILGQPLRLRIAADYIIVPPPTACSTSQYSQTEDYRVLVSANAPRRPIATFLALDSVTCGTPVAFRDQSHNTPTSWRWDFGDGLGSTQQHPQHTYANPGVYTVSLRVCNAHGCDSLTRTGYVMVRADAPRPAPCAPATTGYCCGFGITRVQLGNLDHSSADGRVGYEDFSCAFRSTLTADRPATLHLTTGTNAHDVRVYLDLNDNGQFDLPGELLYQGLAVQNPVASLHIPSTMAGLVYNRPLRLRIWAAAAGATPIGPCAPPQSGQVEDYAVTLLPNAAVPNAQFSVEYMQWCSPTRVAVTNTTTGGATSYKWDFGDGTTSTQAAPVAHAYATSGVYYIRLVAHNVFGSDTLIQVVGVATACPSYCTPAGYGGNTQAPAYFTRVQIAGLDNATSRVPGNGYRDFTAQHVVLRQGRSYQLRAESLPWQFAGAGPWAKVAAWVDYNQDGQMGPSEMIGPLTALSPHTLTLRIPSNALPGATRLRVVIQAVTQSLFLNSCSPSIRNASTEDYTVLILPDSVAPVAGFQADLAMTCHGTVQFRDTSYYSPTAWQWTFGDGTTSALQYPLHTYSMTGTYTVSLRVWNRYGTSMTVQSSYVTVAALAAGPRPAACLPPPGTTSFNRGIGTLNIGSGFSYNQSQSVNAIGYIDETCAVPVVHLVRGTSYPVTITSVATLGVNSDGLYNVYLWLDTNDDGLFDYTTELVYSSGPYGTSQNGTLTLPPLTLSNRPLRLRVQYLSRNSQNFSTAVPAPCHRDEEVGQVRDFAVVAVGTLAAVDSASWLVTNTLYPNPARDYVIIRGIYTKAIEIELLNILGQSVLKTKANPSADGSLRVDLSSLQNGTFLLYLKGVTAHPLRLIIQ